MMLGGSSLLHLCCLWDASARFLRSGIPHKESVSPDVAPPLATGPPPHANLLLPTLLSFSLEQDRWPEWAGTSDRNAFTYNALVNLQQFTGQPPDIRVGANSEDRTTWDPAVPVIQAVFPAPGAIFPYPEATGITVGDGFYQLSRFMPAGTHMTWGLNFAMDDPTIAVNMAKSIMRAFDSPAVKKADVHLDMLELGNEPDFYPPHGIRPSNWPAQAYANDWINMASAVVKALRLNKDKAVSFLSGSFAGQGITPKQIFDAGILSSEPGQLISTVSQHHYSGAFCVRQDFVLSSFMNKASVRGNITIFADDIRATHDRNLNYIFGETGSLACHGAPGVSDAGGAALWVIDYTLQAACNGISKLYFHQGIGFKYNFIQPVTLNFSIEDASSLNPPQPPHVMPSYYGAILVARAIGTSGSARIAEVNVDDDNVSGYAVYEGNRIVRAVFVNLHAWLASSTGSRPSVHLPLDFAYVKKDSLSNVQATVRRLVIRHADDLSGLMFGGQSYETADAMAHGTEQVETITVSDGIALRSTEAVLVNFK